MRGPHDLARRLNYDELAEEALILLREAREISRKLKDDVPATTKLAAITAVATVLQAAATIQHYQDHDN